jgi:hypothetical protein
MEKEFVPYELAVKLKELGFDEECLSYYFNKQLSFGSKTSYGEVVEAPLYQQAFRWFRERYNAVCEIIHREDKNHSTFMGWVYIDNRKIDVVSYWDSKTYEKAELACLIKLIEIVEQKEK